MLNFVIFIAVLLLGQSFAEVGEATATFNTEEISGVLLFKQNADSVTIEGRIIGLSEGNHGFHIHEKGDLSSGCSTTGGHYNPSDNDHGSPNDNNRHLGDLGNVVASSGGTANVNITDKLISLNGVNSIVGRAVVLHLDEDDLGLGTFEDSKVNGHAGTRIACAVIGISDGKMDGSSSTTSVAFWTWLVVCPVLFI